MRYASPGSRAPLYGDLKRSKSKMCDDHLHQKNMQPLKIIGKCAQCGAKLQDVVFDITCEYERMDFVAEPSEIVQVEVHASQSIGEFCSKKCQSEGRLAALSTQHVQLPRTRPSVGPLEVCATCTSLVDMSDWHLTYIESDVSGANCPNQTIDAIEIAVVCKKCAPFSFFKK
jgi:hypothetical protein